MNNFNWSMFKPINFVHFHFILLHFLVRFENSKTTEIPRYSCRYAVAVAAKSIRSFAKSISYPILWWKLILLSFSYKIHLNIRGKIMFLFMSEIWNLISRQFRVDWVSLSLPTSMNFILLFTSIWPYTDVFILCDIFIWEIRQTKIIWRNDEKS